MTYAVSPTASAEDFWTMEANRVGWADNGDPGFIADATPVAKEDYFSLHNKPKLTASVMYLGRVQGVQRTLEELIAGVDMERRTGNIAWRASDDSKRLLTLSKYGIKVTDLRNQEVFLRIPMQDLCSVTHYVEDDNQHVVSLEVADANASYYTYYLFHFPEGKPTDESGTSASLFCKTAEQAFDVLHSKSVLEGHSS